MGKATKVLDQLSNSDLLEFAAKVSNCVPLACDEAAVPDITGVIGEISRRLKASTEKLDQVRKTATECVELNMSNYDENQVAELNGAMIDICVTLGDESSD